MAAAMARPCPVFPEVGSTRVPPGFSRPARSAASIIRMPIRSFTLPPGFSISSLARTVGLTPRVTLRSRTRGVSPMASRNDSMTRIDRLPPWAGPPGLLSTMRSGGDQLVDRVGVAEVQGVVDTHLHRHHPFGVRVHGGDGLDALAVRRQHHPPAPPGSR